MFILYIMLQLLQTYQKRLTNLSTNNKTLLLLRLSDKYFLDLHRLDFSNHKPSFHLIENLIAQKKKITLCSNIDSREENTNKIAHILQKIRRTDSVIQEERGAKNLYVAYPFVQGKLLDGTCVRCPLLFFPVELCLENNEWLLKLLENQSPQWNTTFLLAYKHYNGIALEEDFLEYDFDELSKDAQVFRTELYQMIEKSSLELHFNPDNFTDKLQDFKEYSKKDFETDNEIGKLKLMSEAVLGVFPLADSYLVPDYEQLIKNIAQNTSLQNNTIFGAIAQTPITHTNTHTHTEADFITAYPIDASQEMALQAVKNGESIVVQGPPGTGKSQLICNLITDFLGQGKKVLLVCQKRAALDVVYKRLAEKDFEKSVALVHDIQADRKYIFEQLKQHIERIEEYQKINEGFEVLHAEKRFTKLCKQIDKILEDLNLFRKALYDTSLCGISAKELYLTSNKNAENQGRIIGFVQKKDGIQYKNFSFEQLPNLLSILKTYLSYCLVDNVAFWQDRVSFQNFLRADKTQIIYLLKDIPESWEKLQKNITTTIACKLDLMQLNKLMESENRILDFLQSIQLANNYSILEKLVEQKNIEKAITNFKKIAKELQQALQNNANIEQTLLTKDLAIYVQYLQNYLTAQASLFSRIKWNFGKEKKPLQSLAKNNELVLSIENAKILLQKIENRIEVENIRAKFLDIPFLVETNLLTNSFDLQVFTKYCEQYEKIIFVANATWQQFAKDLLGIEPTLSSLQNFVTHITNVMHDTKKFLTDYQVYIQYFSKIQINELLKFGKNFAENKENIENLQKNIHTTFELLVEFDQFKTTISAQELQVAQQLQTTQKPANEIAIRETLLYFDNHLRLFWLEQIENMYPILRSVSSFKLALLEEELQKYLTEKNELSSILLHQKLREQTYKSLAFNRLNNLVSYRDLKHQVSKKRNVFPLRKLLQAYQDEIFNFMPCWLASPETVSALFEMKDLFDLVIFDEASQCFAEKGIPAVFRGKQLVIAGDDKQLAPFDLYRPRLEENLDIDSEWNTALEVESLLDLGVNELRSYHLRGHYRSKSLDLIDFSNQVFYQNRLQMIPAHGEFIRQEPAIQYVKVDGVWEKNRNVVEAEKVVNLIKTLQAEGKKSIGVITFNIQQQNLILDLLEAKNVGLYEDIFVKNIENVQGDEKDVIIFSLAYAPSPTGRMAMQFGLLNLEKGENRLNVAVTRAIEKIYVVASIFPHQLQTENLLNNGAKILQRYLHYALEVSEGKYKPTLAPTSKQNIDWYLKNQLIEQHTIEINAAVAVPFADLSTCIANRYKLFLTDDDLFYQALSVKEWFAYLPMQLRDKDWDFERKWSRVWWENFVNKNT